MTETWIKLSRKILDWRWYQDNNTKAVFLHLLLTANIEDKDFRTDTIHRGEVATSIGNLAKALKLTYDQARTALEHLKLTNEITITRRPKWLVISIVNYDAYQSSPNQIPIKSQSNPNQIPIAESTQPIEISSVDSIPAIKDKENEEKERTKEKEDKETEKRIKEIEKERYSYGVSKERTRVVFVPPSVEEVTEYCTSRNNNVDAQMFVDFYSSKGWMVGKNKMKDWKAAVRTWERSETREPKRKDAFSKEFWDDIERNKATDK